MAIGAALALGGACLLVVGLGLWAIGQLFPGQPGTMRKFGARRRR